MTKNPFQKFGVKNARLRSSFLLLEKHPELEIWIEALHAIDDDDDKSPLVELLKSTGNERDKLLADLIERYDLNRKKHRPREPIYKMSDEDLLLSLANGTVDKLIAEGYKPHEAIEQAVTKHGTTKSKLEGFRAGQRRSQRKAQALKSP